MSRREREDVVARPLPQNLEAEKALLGALLINNRAWHRVMTLIGPDDFMRREHGQLYAAIDAIIRRGEGADLLTLKAELGPEAAGSIGGAYISGLLDVIPDIANVERYARIVARQSKLRQLIRAAMEIHRRAAEDDDEPEIIAADVLAQLTPAATSEPAQAQPIAKVIKAAFESADARRQADRRIALTTGFEQLDGYSAIRRTFVAVGSPSKHGKSAFLLNLADGLASNGHGCVIFTLESTPEELVWRYASARSGVPHGRIANWALLDAVDFGRLAEVQAQAQGKPIYLTRRIRTIEEIYAECRRLRTLYGIDAALIDYIQLVRHPGGPRDREERVAQIAQTLLEMALELEIAVVAASQVNKDRFERDGGVMYPSDLKYAAAIGESARAVLMFQRPHVDDSERRSCEVAFQVAANNEGRTGGYEWHFDESRQRFGEGGCDRNGCRLAPQEESRLWD